MVFNLSIQCDSIEDLKKSLHELMNESHFVSRLVTNCVGDLSKSGKTFDYVFLDTDDVFHSGETKVIRSLPNAGLPWGG